MACLKESAFWHCAAIAHNPIHIKTYNRHMTMSTGSRLEKKIGELQIRMNFTSGAERL